MPLENLKNCIEKGTCDITLFELKGCPHCEELKEELDHMGIDYDTKEANPELVEMTGIKTAPQLHVITEDHVEIITSKRELKEIF